MDRLRQQNELNELERRLNKGWEVCDQEPNPQKKRRHEDFWRSLLESYEKLHDQIWDRRRSPGPVE